MTLRSSQLPRERRSPPVRHHRHLDDARRQTRPLAIPPRSPSSLSRLVPPSSSPPPPRARSPPHRPSINKHAPPRLSRSTHVRPSLLACATLLASSVRLYQLHEPKTPVFDETHVGRFLNSYSSRAFFFDVHPPLAKLLMLSLSSALGFAGHASCPYESTTPYAASCDLAPQRLLPALCGSAVVPLALLSCGAMELKPLSGLFAAWLILTDTLWLSLSRLHLNDMVLMLFIALTYHLALTSCSLPPSLHPSSPPSTSAPSAPNAALPPSSPSSPSPVPSLCTRTIPQLATGCALACALQCKFGAALPTACWLVLHHLRVVATLWWEGKGKDGRLLGEACLRAISLLAPPIVLHLICFAAHIAIASEPGNGDVYLSDAFRTALRGEGHASSLLSLAWEHAIAQWSYHVQMASYFPRGSHPSDSAWWTWPLAYRGVYFSLISDYASLASQLQSSHRFGVYIHPNPLCILFTTVTAAVTAVRLIMLLFVLPPARLPAPTPPTPVLTFSMRPGGHLSLFLAYLLHWLPYATLRRQTFGHYYLPAYYFAILLSARVVDTLLCHRPVVGTAITCTVAVACGAMAWQARPSAPAPCSLFVPLAQPSPSSPRQCTLGELNRLPLLPPQYSFDGMAR